MSDCNKCRYLAQGTTYCGVGLQVQQSCPTTTLQVPADNCSQYKEGPTALRTGIEERPPFIGRSYMHLEPTWDYNLPDPINTQALNILWPPLPNRTTILRVHKEGETWTTT